jgi:hypothetical protein
VASQGNFGGEFDFIANQDGLAAYDAGQSPNVDACVASASPFTVEASISGYMIDVP